MQIGVWWRRWIEILTRAYFAWRERRRARQSLAIMREGAHFVVRVSRQNRDAALHRDRPDAGDDNTAPVVVAAGAPIPAEVTRTARSSLIIFELPADVVVVRRIAVPVRAREFLPGIIRNQIERLSPWRADQVVYGFDAEANAEDAATLDVRVLIALRSVVDTAREELAGIGLPPDRIVTRQPLRPPAHAEADGFGAPVALWSRLADVPPEHLARTGRCVGAGIAAAVAASFCLSLWAITSAASLGDESEDVAARIKTAQRQMQGPTRQSLASLNPRERAWYAKETSPTASIVLEALSRALPDGAYLTELRLENATLRVIGLARDVPSLIAPLERSGHLNDVHFFAQTTRGPDGSLFRFNIEARVEPHFRIAEDQP